MIFFKMEDTADGSDPTETGEPPGILVDEESLRLFYY